MDEEGGELEAADEAVGVCVVHVLVVDDDVVLGGHVVGDVVVDDEAEQAVEEGEVHFFVELLELGLEHDVALALARLPDT